MVLARPDVILRQEQVSQKRSRGRTRGQLGSGFRADQLSCKPAMTYLPGSVRGPCGLSPSAMKTPEG